MSVRAMLLEISARTGISVNTLKSRWRVGARGDELEKPRVAGRPRQRVEAKRREGGGIVLPVRVPMGWWDE